MAGVASGGSMWKNILIGILTTVVAYSIVNYVKDRKEKKKEKEKLKTETIQAWQSLINYEELSTNNYFAAFCNEEITPQLESMIYEKDQLAKNYAIIGNKQGIDEDLISFATRAIGNTNEIKKILENYLAEIKRINPYEPFSQSDYDAIDSVYMVKLNLARERDTASLHSTFRNLVSKYGDDILIPREEKMPAPSDITGNWKETGIDKTFALSDDKKFTMTAGRTDYHGKWELDDKTIKMKFDDGSGSINIKIIRFNARYIRFTMNNETNERQLCKK